MRRSPRHRRPARARRRTSTSTPPARRGHLDGHRGVARRLEAGRVAVVPAAVQPPDVADHELGLVVGGLQIRAWSSSRRAPSPCARSCRASRPSFISSRVWPTSNSSAVATSSSTVWMRSRPPIGSPWAGSSSSGSRAASRAAPAPTRAGSAAPSAGCRRSGTPRSRSRRRTRPCCRGIHAQVWSSVSPRPWRSSMSRSPTVQLHAVAVGHGRAAPSRAGTSAADRRPRPVRARCRRTGAG